MLLSAVSVLVVAQSIFEIPEGLMNNPVYIYTYIYIYVFIHIYPCLYSRFKSIIYIYIYKIVY